MPAAIGEEVDAARGIEGFAGLGWPGFTRGEAKRVLTERFANLEPGRVGRDAAAIRLHAEEHGDGFVDGQGSDPVVIAAPRGERGDGKGQARRHLRAEVFEKLGIEWAL